MSGRDRIAPTPAIERDGNYALIFGAHKQLTGAWQQRRDQDSRSQRARETSALEHSDTQHGADVSFIACYSDRLDLAIGQSLRFPERVGFPGVPVEHTLSESSYPQVRFCSRERRDVNIAEGRMKNCYLPSVVEQDTALPGSNQQMSGGCGQDGGDSARACILGKDLPEGAAVKSQQAILSSGDDESLLL